MSLLGFFGYFFRVFFPYFWLTFFEKFPIVFHVFCERFVRFSLRGSPFLGGLLATFSTMRFCLFSSALASHEMVPPRAKKCGHYGAHFGMSRSIFQVEGQGIGRKL